MKKIRKKLCVVNIECSDVFIKNISYIVRLAQAWDQSNVVMSYCYCFDLLYCCRRIDVHT